MKKSNSNCISKKELVIIIIIKQLTLGFVLTVYKRVKSFSSFSRKTNWEIRESKKYMLLK